MFRKALAIAMLVTVTGLLGVLLGLNIVAAQQGPSAMRSFDQDTVAPGGTLVVTITATGYGSLGGLTETLPMGFSYVSSTLDDRHRITLLDDGQKVRFIFQGAVDAFTYTVTAPSTAGSHSFIGSLTDDDRGNTPVSGDIEIMVGSDATSEPDLSPGDMTSPTPTDPTASRSFDNATVTAGAEVVVTITATGYGSFGGVTERLPAGFSYVSSTLSTDEVAVTGQTVRFTLQGAVDPFTYTVTTPRVAGTHVFSGSLRDENRLDYPVGGETDITVPELGETVPTANRSLPRTTVSPGGSVVVTITASDYGVLGGVVETLPDGSSYLRSRLTDGVIVEGQTVTFIFQGVVDPFTYTVHRPSKRAPALRALSLRTPLLAPLSATPSPLPTATMPTSSTA